MSRPKKSIGIYLSAKPNYGGTYQYSMSIIDAISADQGRKYNVACYYSDPEWEPLIPDYFNKNLVVNSKLSEYILKIIGKLFPYLNGRVYAKFLSNIVKNINSSNCELFIYPSQDKYSYQASKKSICSIHDLMHRYEPEYAEYSFMERYRRDIHYSAICRYSKIILVDSKIGLEHVVNSYKVDIDNIKILKFVSPNYLLNLKEEDVILKYGLESKYIFYPAQFWEHKNHINLLKSIKILKERGLNVNLVLVGSQKNNYKKVLLQIKDLGISENVRILGYISNSELLSLYRNAIGMVFVSFLGPTNIPPMESMVTGCPLICSDAYAMPEQVGDAGLLINPRDPFDIANKIEKIWNDAELRKELSKLGEERSKEYSLVNFRFNLMEYINIALGK